jgi:c-di-GMP-binding flagellar brake protein YcgR
MKVPFDKRQTPRVPIYWEVTVVNSSGTFKGKGRDLSLGGVGVYLEKLPPVGSNIELSFKIPDNNVTVNTSGEVIYHFRGEPGTADDWMGVKFTRMDNESHNHIREYFLRNQKK